MLKTKCTNCGHEFSDREALCDDWRDSEKSHGCPECETFFIREEITRNRIYPWVAGLFGGGIMYPAVSIVMNADDWSIQMMAGIILLSSFIIVLLTSGDTIRELKPSPWTEQRRKQNH